MEIKDLRRLRGILSLRLPALTAIAALMVFAPPSAGAAGPRAAFNIPAGDARTTLLEFYVQSGVQVLYLAETMIALKDTKRACIALAEFGEAYPALAAGRLQGQYERNLGKVTCS